MKKKQKTQMNKKKNKKKTKKRKKKKQKMDKPKIMTSLKLISMQMRQLSMLCKN